MTKNRINKGEKMGGLKTVEKRLSIGTKIKLRWW